MTDEKKVELLPCPFCGSKDVFLRWNGIHGTNSIICQCGTVIGLSVHNDEAIETWNTRAKRTATMEEDDLAEFIYDTVYQDCKPKSELSARLQIEILAKEILNKFASSLPRPLGVEKVYVYEGSDAEAEELNKLRSQITSLKSVIGRLVEELKLVQDFFVLKGSSSTSIADVISEGERAKEDYRKKPVKIEVRRVR